MMKEYVEKIPSLRARERLEKEEREKAEKAEKAEREKALEKENAVKVFKGNASLNEMGEYERDFYEKHPTFNDDVDETLEMMLFSDDLDDKKGIYEYELYKIKQKKLEELVSQEEKERIARKIGLKQMPEFRQSIEQDIDLYITPTDKKIARFTSNARTGGWKDFKKSYLEPFKGSQSELEARRRSLGSFKPVDLAKVTRFNRAMKAGENIDAELEDFFGPGSNFRENISKYGKGDADFKKHTNTLFAMEQFKALAATKKKVEAKMDQLVDEISLFKEK